MPGIGVGIGVWSVGGSGQAGAGLPEYTFAADFTDRPGWVDGLSYTRSTAGALVQQFDGSFVQPLANEIPLSGGRRTGQLIVDANDLAPWSLTGASKTIDAGLGAIEFAKTTTGTSAAGFTAAQASSYTASGFRIELFAGASTQLSIGLLEVTWAPAGEWEYEIESGPGVSAQTSGVGTGLLTVTGLSATVPTVLRFKQQHAGTTNRHRIYVYPDTHLSTTIGASIKVRNAVLSDGYMYPTEYVSNGELSAPYHGWGVDGVRWYRTDEYGNDLRSEPSGHPVRCTGIARRPAITNSLLNNQWLDTPWVIRGTVARALMVDPQVGKYTQLTGIGFSGNDAYYVLSGASVSTAIEYGFLIRRQAGSGVLEFLTISNPGTAGKWDIDYTSLPVGEWALINRDHPSVTVASEFVTGTAGGWGPVFRKASGVDDFDFDITCITAEIKAARTPVANLVPTTSTAVTTNAEVIALDDEVIGYDQDGGVWVIEQTPQFAKETSLSNQFVLYALTDSNNRYIVYNISGTGMGLYIISGGVVQTSIPTGNWVAGQSSVVAVRIEDDDVSVIVDGVVVGTDTTSTVPTISTLTVGGILYAGSFAKIAYFAPGTISDAQLLALSSGGSPYVPLLESAP